jgi:truncated hemoglobin YjbI
MSYHIILNLHLSSFRIRCKYSYGWDMFSSPSAYICLPAQSIKCISAPIVKNRDVNSITLEWDCIEHAIGYTLRYRPENELTWVEIPSIIKTNIAKKKGLEKGTKYCFSVKAVVESPDEQWCFSRSSVPISVLTMTCAKLHTTQCGYTTVQGRYDWLRAHGLANDDASKITQSLDADPNIEATLYYWQLYSLLGSHRIEALIRSFYERVYNDWDESWFRDAFVQISGVEHHIATQTAFWIDVMGGGRQYHGGDYRLNFHHTNNAAAVMNARGATRWMYHMKHALNDHRVEFNSLDPRIVPCIIDFLRTKMMKYADEHSWKFNPADFADI